MNLHRLQRQCEAVLRDITLPDPFSIEALCAQVAAQRRRPLRFVVESTLGGGLGPCGVWVATETEDLVFVEHATSLVHREHIVLHELGHMLAGHDGHGTDSMHRLAADLLPNVDPSTVRMVLGRAAYGTVEEQEAEMIASLILARTARPVPPRPQPATAITEPGVLRRLAALLDEPTG